jgi:tRNA1(Val) A37 N6-methylase TrmN6
MNCAPMGIEPDSFETSEDAVLGGRLRLRQPKRGHRVGHDAILLAAATGGRTGERAADLGAGIGGAGLALAARVAGLDVTLVEIDQALCALASGNALLNGLESRVRAVCADVADIAGLPVAGLAQGHFDRVLMNPPFNDGRRQNVSPDPSRRLAHVATPDLLTHWVAAADWLLKPQGVLTLIWRADGLTEVLDALAGKFGSVAVLSVYPREAAPPIRVLARAVKGGQAGLIDYPGLTLNDEQGKPTAAAEAVLRGGETLKIAD